MDSAKDFVAENVVFRRNGAPTSGGAAFFAGAGARGVIRGCVFEGNAAGDGGALYSAARAISLVDSSFVGNAAAGDGGAVWASGPRVDARGTTFSRNRAGGVGGAVAVDGDGSAVFASGGCAWVSVEVDSTNAAGSRSADASFSAYSSATGAVDAFGDPMVFHQPADAVGAAHFCLPAGNVTVFAQSTSGRHTRVQNG